MDTQTINRNFTHHPPHGDQVERYQSLRESGRLLALKVNQLCPDSREKSLAITKVEEDAAPKEFEQEFADDIISLVASYSGRMYGRRGGRKKKVQPDE